MTAAVARGGANNAGNRDGGRRAVGGEAAGGAESGRPREGGGASPEGVRGLAAPCGQRGPEASARRGSGGNGL